MGSESYDTTRSCDQTPAEGLEGGLALVQEAEEGGSWKPLIGWLARNPALAGEIDQFLADQDKIRAIMNCPVVAGRTGSVMAGCQVLEEIGRGGMGVVYRAYDPKLKREVAIKVEKSVSDKARFRYEAEVLASFTHPNIVPILSFEEDRDGLCLVMPLMTGGSLAERLRQLGPDRCLPADEAAEIVRDIALGVHHAHQHGLIHRDLKPGNILLDRDGTPHVADFGLAHPVDVTISVVAGAPAYMAPEQVRGDKHLTIAVDVHALGVILFELLTGRTPFVAPDVATIIKRIVEELAPPVRQFRPNIPMDLETICMRCLQKEPSDRYSSAKQVAEDLVKYLRGEPIDSPKRSRIRDAVVRAFGNKIETTAMATWATAFWGAASTILAMVVIQAAVLLNVSEWVLWTGMAYYLIAWVGILWLFLAVKHDELNQVERRSLAIQFGMALGCAAIIPAQAGLDGSNLLHVLPAFVALIGLGIYAHGILYWGRFYMIGLLFFAIAAIMPLLPILYWPGIYGLLLGVLQVWAGLHLRRVHHEAIAAGKNMEIDPDRSAPAS